MNDEELLRLYSKIIIRLIETNRSLISTIGMSESEYYEEYTVDLEGLEKMVRE